MQHLFKNKRVLVTGACGTVGQELVRQLLEHYSVGELIALDNNESELFFLEQKYCGFNNTFFFLADIRDRDKLERKMRGVDIAFHTAAYKHVVLCERSPFEAIQTNILGVQNIIQAASAARVKRIIFTSSDKAVNPTNVMGTSKLMGERLITAANNNACGMEGIFTSTRFGNVLGSRGSVIPIFREQIRTGGPVTLTDPDMTRFILSIHQAVKLVIDSAEQGRGGEVFVTKMPVIRIKDLAEVMIREVAPCYGHDPANIDIEIIGSKPGEKFYEELMTEEEVRRTVELKDYFIIRPAFSSYYNDIDYSYSNVVAEKITHAYNSANEIPLSKVDLVSFMYENGLLDFNESEVFKPDVRYWGDEKN